MTASARVAAPAELVLLGGGLVTMVGERPAAAPDAGIAVVDGRIAAVGGRAELEAWIGEATTVVDLPAGVVLPGLVDCHIHPVFGIELTRGADLSGCRSITEAQERLRDELGTLGEGEWLLGWGLEPAAFEGGEVDNRMLDEVAGDRPAFLRMFDAHAALASSAALELAGVRGDEGFSDGSRLARRADGTLSGALLELQAMALVQDHVPPLTTEQRADRLLGILRHMAEAGFTAGQVQDLAPGTIDLLERIEAERDLPIRLRLSPWFEPGTAFEEVERLVALQGRGGRDWSVRGVKMMIDGTIDNGTAWLHRPDCHGQSTGSLWLEPAQYGRALRELDARGVPTTTHAIGDAGVAHVTDAIASLPRGGATHRIEHIEVLDDDVLDRLRASGATASMQPTHCTRFVRADGTDNWSERLGEERASRGFRTADVARAGIPLALGSDWPVAPSDAVGILADAQLRRAHEDVSATPVGAGQSLTALEALRGFTTASAESIGERGGTLEVGAVADVTVLDVDPLTADPQELSDARVLLTVVGGRIVVDDHVRTA